MSSVLPPAEFTSAPSDPERLTLLARPAGQSALYLYPGEPTPVSSKPYADMLNVLEIASRNGDPSVIQRFIGPESESIKGMIMEFRKRGVDIGWPRTLPQIYCLAVEAGHLPIHRSEKPERIFNADQLQILDYAALGFTRSEIPGLMGITEDEFQDRLTSMGRQANCGAGLLRLMRRATEGQSRRIEFSLPPHDPIHLPKSNSLLQALTARSYGKHNPEIALDNNRSLIAQQKYVIRLLKAFQAGRVAEATAKAIVLGLIEVIPREPEGRPLSDRQLEALTLAALGNTGPKIESKMGLGANSSTSFFARALDKLGAKSVEHTVLRAFEDGTFIVKPTTE